MKHVLCMVWTVDNESMCCVWMWTVDSEACVMYGVDCGQ